MYEEYFNDKAKIELKSNELIYMELNDLSKIQKKIVLTILKDNLNENFSNK